MKFRNRRGLSTVVTTMIMISAVAVMGTFVVSWANSNLSTHQKNLQTTYSTSTNKLNEKIIFENVWRSTLPNTINITVNNVGTTGLNVTEIKINKNSQQIYLWKITNGGLVIGESYSLNNTYTSQGNPIDIFVTTERGNIFRTQVSP